MENAKVMSGIQPTGDIHIGNYLGALRQWVEMTKDHECFFVIVDYHAITIDYDVSGFQQNIINAAMVNIACGLEPGTCRLVIQSHIPEIMELNWIFASCAMVGRLTNMTQFKEKSAQHEANINAGLLNYPILQAADILVYKASLVPVGEDQFQHLEFAREIARRFNKRFGETFPEPEPCGKPARVLGLDGENKMSKSLKNYIGVLDSPEVLWKKLAPAKTDVQRVKRTDPGRPELCNIFSYHGFFTPEDIRQECHDACRKAEIGCVDCKKILHEHLSRSLEPIRNRYQELVAHPNIVHDFLNESAKQAREIASETMDEVRHKMGIRP
ncbi:MAG: tryptophan--tRNA ligase [Desulfobacteraceae bacterium]